MKAQSWIALWTLSVLSCGTKEPERLQDSMATAQVPTPGLEQSGEGSGEFRCFQGSKYCRAQALSNSTDCRRDRDYTVTVTKTDSPVAVLSIHGGKIEPYTTEVSKEAVRRFGWNHYDFNAHGTAECLHGQTDRDRLHITATKFDDPIAHELVTSHPKVVAIHGDRNIEKIGTMCVGGDNRAQILAFIASINGSINSSKGSQKLSYLKPVDTVHSQSFPCNAVAGTDQTNIVNLARGGKGGLQLELSLPLLKNLANSDDKYDSLRDVFYGALNTAMSVPVPD